MMKIEVKTSPMGATAFKAEQGEDALFCGSDFCKPLISNNRRQRRWQKPLRGAVFSSPGNVEVRGLSAARIVEINWEWRQAA